MARPNSIWFRKDIGWWMVTLNGQKIRLAKGKENKSDAERAFHELMAVRPQRPDTLDSRVCDLAEAFLEFAKNKKFSPDTYRNYRFYLMGFCGCAGYRLAREVIPNHVTNWLTAPKENGDPKEWNDTTQYNAKRTVFRLFSWAKEEGLLAKNPLAGMTREKPEPKRRCLTEGEYCSLLRGARRPFRVLLWSLMETGARPSELRRLKWDEVNGTKCTIRKHKTAKKVRKPRVIYLTERMQKRLNQLRKRSTSSYVFVNSRNEPWTANAVRLQVDRIKKRCGVADDVCVYLVRHTYATWALVRGVDPASLAEILGHADTNMIMEVYLHLADQKVYMSDVAERAARRPGRPKPPANGKRSGE
ncbi:MAG: site-specific integrase [Thermoguttaceae bacterium]|jgi:integrase